MNDSVKVSADTPNYVAERQEINMKKIRGVNLGGWLVLERWIAEDLFSGVSALDETYLGLELGPERVRERLKVHRDEFITERDFEDMAVKGFNAVRIPVPFFLFEDVGPYVHCYEYLDKAFDWAEKYGLKVLVDLHTVPGGHNGTDNSGIIGICLWSTKEKYREDTLRVLERIAQRYGKREGMWGIGVLNEPMCSDKEIGKVMNIQNLSKAYIPVDKEVARDNTNYSLAYLKEFYLDAYQVIRRHMSPEKYVLFSDAFELEIWDDFLLHNDFEGVALDTHHYLMTPDMTLFREKNLKVYREYLEALGKKISPVAKRLPVVVGEWNIQNQADGLAEMSQAERDELYSGVAEGFQAAMNDCLGWFYWTYKVIMKGLDQECDDAARCVNHGWLRF